MKNHVDRYTAVIGLEIHAQLLTKSKAYSSDSTEYGNMPNTNVSAITMGLPGTLPRINRQVIDHAIKIGLACHSNISHYNEYARKNYFYPDLPKGYQITQDKTPICTGGYLLVDLDDSVEKKIGITRIHMEEDAGKSLHIDGETETLVDYNRAGVALVEIVSEPDMRSSKEAYAYLQEVRKIVRYLGICDGNLEEGSLRCDANISVMLNDATEFGVKVEVKNMNSFRNVQRAIDFEINRQINELELGNSIPSETRNFDAIKGQTISMRSKENLNDYRFFPEPDLPLLLITDEWISEIASTMPTLPRALKLRFINDYKLPEYDAKVLTESKEIALYFDDLCKHTSNYKSASNWVMGPVKSYLNELTLHINNFPISPPELSELIELIDSNKISHSIAVQRIFPLMLQEQEKSVLRIAEENNLLQESDSDSIKPLIDDVLLKYPEKVQEYKNGNKNLLGLFMGEVMKASHGKADPKLTNKMLIQILEK